MSTTPEASTPDENLHDRRTVLRGAAAVGLAGAAVPLLAACGGSDSGAKTDPSASAPASSEPASTAPTSAPASSGGGEVLGPVSDVPVGGGKIYADAKVVVTQPTAGRYKGFSAVCTHNGCILADVAGGTINCGCHGSKFKIADGSVANGPASSPLASVQVTVK
ncbi:MAG TPA: Rieske (2Fe-2S) protein, partial [Kribbellaceae bacterium]